SALAGQTGSSLSWNNVSASDADSYSVVVSGTCGNSVTVSASLTVNQDVAISSGPISLTNCPGTSANFSVSAIGTGLSYQWSKEDSALAGQNADILTLNNMGAADAGTYSVVVSGSCANTVTNSATLMVNQSVSTSPLTSLVKCPGQSATFSTSTGGSGPL